MRKAMGQLEDHLKKVDVFIEVRDARLPKSSENPDLIAILPEGMKRLVIYNKIDLVPARKASDLLKEMHKDDGIPYMTLSTKENININKLLQFI